MSEEHPNRAFIDGLRAMADFLVAHPLKKLSPSQDFFCFFDTKEEIVEAIKGLGKVEKSFSDDWFFCIKQITPEITLRLCLRREQACKRIVKGTRVVAAKPERVLPAEPERVEEIVEWDCPPSILAGNENDTRSIRVREPLPSPGRRRRGAAKW